MFRQPTKFLDSDQIIDIIENLLNNKKQNIERKANNQSDKPKVTKEYKYIGDDIPWLF